MISAFLRSAPTSFCQSPLRSWIAWIADDASIVDGATSRMRPYVATADASSPYRVAANAVPFGLRAERLFARESSLRRASLALSALGAIAFTGAELFEHGLWWTL